MRDTRFASRSSEWIGDMTVWMRDHAEDNSDQRERLLMAYAAYLEAEIRYVSYLLAALLQELPQAQQAEILAAMTYMQALDGFYDGPGSVAPERLADGTDRAWETLKEARRALTAQGFSVPWEET